MLFRSLLSSAVVLLLCSAMAGPATVRSGRRCRGRPPGIRAAVIARVRRAAGRISSVDSSSTMAFAGGRGRPADSGCRLRSGSRRPFRSSRAVSWRDVNVDVDSRRREISLGKRPVDCTVGAAVGACSSSVAGGSVPAVWPASVFCLSKWLTERVLLFLIFLLVFIFMALWLVIRLSIAVQEWCLYVPLVSLVGLLLL